MTYIWKGITTEGIKLDRAVLEKFFFVKEAASKGMQSQITVQVFLHVTEEEKKEDKKTVTLIELKRANNVGMRLLTYSVTLSYGLLQEFCYLRSRLD